MSAFRRTAAAGTDTDFRRPGVRRAARRSSSRQNRPTSRPRRKEEHVRDTPTTSRLGWVVGLTSTAYFMVVLDALVVITALPRMQRDMHVGLASLQWTVNAYGIAFAAGIVTAAALGDRFGRRLVFCGGLALFTLASAACAVAPDVAGLIAARTVQGLGAAVVLPLSLTILTTAFPPEKRGMIVGVYGGLAGLAVALGPIVGGAIAEGLDWHWIFWINVPIGLAAVVLGTPLLPESHGAPEGLDLAGVTLVTAGVVALVWSLTRANDVGWASGQIVAGLVAGSLLLAAFVWWRAGRPRRSCRSGCSGAASSRSATSPPTSCTAPPSPPRSSSRRSSSSRAATRRSAPGSACCRSS